MIGKYKWLISLIIIVAMGYFLGKILNNADFSNSRYLFGKKTISRIPLRNVLISVGDVPIIKDDLEWEYKLHTHGIIGNSDLTAIPDIGSNLHEDLSPLKERLLTTIIERKLLYKFVSNDSSFDLTDAARYTACIQEWQDAISDESKIIFTESDKERLKNRLCEKSIIDQYIEERVFSQVEVSEAEMINYYKDHLHEFSKDDRVIIRHILLASEREARDILSKLNSENFATYAIERSISPESQDGGLLAPFAKGEMPRVFDIAFTMRSSEIRGVLKSTYGFHIIMLEKKLLKIKLGFDEAKAKISVKIKKDKREREYQKWLELALNSIPITGPKPDLQKDF